MIPDYEPIISENQQRRAVLFEPYDPLSGAGSPIERKKVQFSAGGSMWSYFAPVAMYEAHKNLFDRLLQSGSVESLIESIEEKVPERGLIKELIDIRFKYDFEFWAVTCVKIQDKETKKLIPFTLNRPQRKVLARLERMRLAGIPIRMIILKARQWGGSTLVQVYMAWIQLILKCNWHSAVITDVEDQARNIRGMYSRLAKEYPKSIGSVKFVPYEGSTKNKLIKDRNCIIGVGSVQKPDSLRSFDFAMTHMSEVGLWKSTPQKSAEDLVQGVRATVPDVPDSLSVLESTAKGVGNFFHREWQAAVEEKSSYDAVFVGWHEIERYQKPITDLTKFITWMLGDAYGLYLWNTGATLEGIKWYFDTKNGENYDDWRMKSEFPSSPAEAFQSTGRRVFAPGYVQLARKNCKKPAFYGEIYPAVKGKQAFKRVEFHQNDKGLFLIWEKPDTTLEVSNRYIVSVDIGGRTDKADWSVIKVFDRYWMMEGGKPEVVACWRGHLDQDLISWKAAQISKYYNNALLVIESNSLDSQESEGDHFLTVLDEIVKYYPNIFARTDAEKIRQGLPLRYGFQTNMSTKPMVIDLLNGILREEGYYERDLRSCDEMDTYEIKPTGKYGAVEGCKDDLVMATAIGLWAAYKYMDMPKLIQRSTGKLVKKIISEASI
jgi:hypothetical protein